MDRVSDSAKAGAAVILWMLLKLFFMPTGLAIRTDSMGTVTLS